MMEAELASMVQRDTTNINAEVLEVFIDSMLMEAGYSDAFLKDFFTSLNVKVSVNKINAEILLNFSVLLRGSAKGNRTLDFALRGRRLSRLTIAPSGSGTRTRTQTE